MLTYTSCFWFHIRWSLVPSFSFAQLLSPSRLLSGIIYVIHASLLSQSPNLSLCAVSVLAVIHPLSLPPLRPSVYLPPTIPLTYAMSRKWQHPQADSVDQFFMHCLERNAVKTRVLMGVSHT